MHSPPHPLLSLERRKTLSFEVWAVYCNEVLSTSSWVCSLIDCVQVPPLLTFCISTRELNALFICRFFLPWIRHRWPSDCAYELGLVVEESRVMVILGIQLIFCGYTNHLLQNMGHKLWGPKFSQVELKSQHLHLAFLNLWTLFHLFSI